MATWLILPAAVLVAASPRLATAADTIQCVSASPVSLQVGDTAIAETVCIMPEGCNSVSEGQPANVPYYGPKPVVMRTHSTWAANFSNVTIRNTFRGFDNMLGARETLTVNVSQEIQCSSGDESVAQWINLSVEVMRSAINTAPWMLPSQIPVPCLVVGSATRVVAAFHSTNASASHAALRGSWARGADMPWVLSRPASAVRIAPDSRESYDAWSQPILQEIEDGPNSSSLTLVLKPPADGDDVSWQVCITPGDGYNYYSEVCTEEFAVRADQAACDTPSPVDGAPRGLFPGARALTLTTLGAIVLDASARRGS